jgi:hypothetical protein
MVTLYFQRAAASQGYDRNPRVAMLIKQYSLYWERQLRFVNLFALHVSYVLVDHRVYESQRNDRTHGFCLIQFILVI